MKPTLPARFSLEFEFDPNEGIFFVRGEVLDEFFPGEEFGRASMALTLEELADAFSDLFESEEDEDDDDGYEYQDPLDHYLG